MPQTQAQKPRTYIDEFKSRVDKLELDAQNAGTNLTAVCRLAGVSRATPDRWRKHPPKTIELVAKMEKIVADAAAARDKEGAPAH